ncbi:MAG: UDP-glucose/GDP-mannose dehydrogenase family protein, partial [Calditrichia bacterium]|nr:UDP-glucose/GDP-mannose dehydrogenase family protein [Calditrichia bacterium]
MKLTVVGSGYVGLVAGACFAESGNDVICVDKDEQKILDLKNGKIPIYEPGLDAYVKRNVEKGRLTFTTSLENGVNNSDIIFIAVGTPPDEDGSADLSYVLAVAEGVAKNMKKHKIIINKSTVPVGTAEKVAAKVKEHTDITFDVVSNPEFLKEGSAIDDFMYPDRVVIGTGSEKTAETMKELYAPFVRTGNPIVIMDNKSAEITKYAANALLATKISFMNEMARLCDKTGADISMIRKGIGSDSRIGYSFIFPGVGYGGSCFPKDVKAIIKTANSYDEPFKLLAAVEEVNEEQKEYIIPKILNYFNGDIKGKNFAVWGLSFKPKTDDMREAPAIVIINKLVELGATIQAYDPEAMDEARRRK